MLSQSSCIETTFFIRRFGIYTLALPLSARYAIKTSYKNFSLLLSISRLLNVILLSILSSVFSLLMYICLRYTHARSGHQSFRKGKREVTFSFAHSTHTHRHIIAFCTALHTFLFCSAALIFLCRHVSVYLSVCILSVS